ncbi:helix-turn-helix domain-containing protein [Amycolatopsis sp. GM8]|uniref:helix-turn-helix domain-containing protein n=1 Tax=Amycolatopsis sp. GM8 TaxID=2896530 RepID=UPI001F3E9B64|nr:helix-turn-helix domain-containing protein [Amycolatopsis sp. GM8]
MSRSAVGRPPGSPDEVLSVWMRAMTDSIRAINAEQDLSKVLAMIARQACELVDLQKCAVYVLDPELGTFRLEGSYGLTPAYVDWANAEPMRLDEGTASSGPPTARAALTGLPVFVEDAFVEPGLDRWHRSMSAEGLRGVAATPLQTADGPPIGTITGYTTARRRFDMDSIRLLTLLSEHAAAAIVAARRRDRERDAVTRLSRANDELVEHQRTVSRLRDLQHDLTRLLLQDVGLQGIAEFLARQLNATITIDTEDGTELATAPAGSGSRRDIAAVLTDDSVQTQIARIIESGRAGNLVWHGASAICLVPVSTGGPSRPRLWAARNSPERFDDDERWAMEGCALLIALERSRVERRAEAEARLTKDLLSDLLSPAAMVHAESVMARAAALRHAPHEPHTLAVFLVPANGKPPAELTRALLDVARDVQPRPVIGSVGDYVVALIPSTTANGPDETASQLLARMVERVRDRTNGSARCVVGATVPSLTKVERGLTVVLRAGSLVTPASREVTRMADYGVHGLLLESGAGEALREFADATLAPVDALDEHGSGEILTTLRTWFASNMSNREAGTKLFVHANTVGYRIKRAAGATGLDLTNPADLMTLQLALMVRGISGR